MKINRRRVFQKCLKPQFSGPEIPKTPARLNRKRCALSLTKSSENPGAEAGAYQGLIRSQWEGRRRLRPCNYDPQGQTQRSPFKNEGNIGAPGRLHQ